jgi:hypothetical protein
MVTGAIHRLMAGCPRPRNRGSCLAVLGANIFSFFLQGIADETV